LEPDTDGYYISGISIWNGIALDLNSKNPELPPRKFHYKMQLQFNYKLAFVVLAFLFVVSSLVDPAEGAGEGLFFSVIKFKKCDCSKE
jgi:hypothetical protein